MIESSTNKPPDADVLSIETISRKVRMFIDLVKSARKVRADNTNLPDEICADQVHQVEKHLRNTFGLLYVQAPFIKDIDERRTIAKLKEEVRVVMPEYVDGLIPKVFAPEAEPETVPESW